MPRRPHAARRAARHDARAVRARSTTCAPEGVEPASGGQRWCARRSARGWWTASWSAWGRPRATGCEPSRLERAAEHPARSRRARPLDRRLLRLDARTRARARAASSRRCLRARAGSSRGRATTRPLRAPRAAVLDALADGPRRLAELRDRDSASRSRCIRRMANDGQVRHREPADRTAGRRARPRTAAHRGAGARDRPHRRRRSRPARAARCSCTASPARARPRSTCTRSPPRSIAGSRRSCLVPEIALAPQTAGRISARFGERVAVLHSGLSDGARAAAYARIRSGDADVVVGSALGRARAGLATRPRRRRRGARRRLQAGRRPALRRAARRAAARARGRCAAARLLGDAAAGELARPRAHLAQDARGRPVAAGRGRRPARRPALPALAPAARRARCARRRGRAGDPPAQPPGRGARAALPRLRARLPLPELRRQPDAVRRARPALPPLRPLREGAAHLPDLRRRRHRAARRGHRARRRGRDRRLRARRRRAAPRRGRLRAARCARGGARALRARAARRARRHPDGRQGARRARRAPRRRARRRPGPAVPRLPQRGAHVLAARRSSPAAADAWATAVAS